MFPPARFSALASVLILTFGPFAAQAEWLANGTPIVVQSAAQGAPRLATDGRDGVFASGSPCTCQIWAQRLMEAGNYALGWPAEGLTLPGGTPPGEHWGFDLAGVAPDGEGGVYIVSYAEGPWCGNGCYFDPVQLFVQRLTAGGFVAPGWPSGGVRVEATWLGHLYMLAHPAALVPDEKHGVLIAWPSPHGAVIWSDPSVVVQSIGPHGERRWGDDGLEIRQRGGVQSDPVIVADGAGGAFAFWGDVRPSSPGTRVYGQHVSAAGEPLWQVNGAPISHSGFTRFDGPVAVSDGVQGAIVTWAGSQGADLDIYAARVAHPHGPGWKQENPSARGAALPWGQDVKLCGATGDQDSMRVIAMPGGGAIVAWLDGRLPAGQGVYAQRVSRQGRTLWTPNGVPLCAAPGSRGPLALATDGSGGAYVAWGDTRPQGELYAMRVTARGIPSRGWPADGAIICQWQPTYYPFDRGFDGLDMMAISGGRAIVAWQDVRQARQGDGPLPFAMLLTRDGPAVSPPGGSIASPLAQPVSAQPASFLELQSANPVFALRGVQPNPASNPAVVRFALPDAAPATLSMFDISGRRLWSRDVATFGPGEHSVPIGEGVWFPRLASIS